MITRKALIVLMLFFLFPFLFCPAISLAWEKVENVRVEQVGEDVHIYYDLRGDEDKYQVKVRGSSDGGSTYALPMKSVSGDVGKDVRPGSGKRIIWKAPKDAGELEGDAFVFEVEAVAGPGKEFSNSIGMKFVLIPAGSFTMGSPSNEPGRDNDERQHRVTISKPFYMQTTEVTQVQWREIMGNNPSCFKDYGDDYPVEKVSWKDVQEFIRRLNKREGTNDYRLPTETEWEYACRAGSDTAFANGDITEMLCRYDPNLDKMGWYCGNSRRRPFPVAQKEPNSWGLYDMHGNVWEWCQDSCSWKKEIGVQADTYRDGIVDPVCIEGSRRIFRGGSWNDSAMRCRSAYRARSVPGCRLNNLGFRVVSQDHQL